jgi:protein subunit release factor A
MRGQDRYTLNGMLPQRLRAKLEAILAQLPQVEAQLAEPAVLSDPQALQRLGKQHAELSELKACHATRTMSAM